MEKEREGRGRVSCSVLDSNEKTGQGSGCMLKSFDTYLERDKAWDRCIQPPATMRHSQEGLRPDLPGRFGIKHSVMWQTQTETPRIQEQTVTTAQEVKI